MSIEVGSAQWLNENNQTPKTSVLVMFYDREVQNMKRTEETGHACYDLRTYIRKVVPGDNLVNIDRPVRDADKHEFPVEWQRYQSKSDKVDGTPVEQWPILNRAQVAEFKALNILSVEQFLAMPDGHGSKIMGFNMLKQKAREFLNWRQESEKVEEIKAKDAEKDARIASLEGQIAELRAMMEKPRRGRQRKADAAHAA